MELDTHIRFTEDFYRVESGFWRYTFDLNNKVRAVITVPR